MNIFRLNKYCLLLPVQQSNGCSSFMSVPLTCFDGSLYMCIHSQFCFCSRVSCRLESYSSCLVSFFFSPGFDFAMSCIRCKSWWNGGYLTCLGILRLRTGLFCICEIKVGMIQHCAIIDLKADLRNA